MATYEEVEWESGVLEGNIRNMRSHLKALAGENVAGVVESIARKPGPLHVALACVSSDLEAPSLASTFYANIIHHIGVELGIGKSHDGEKVKDLTQLLGAFFAWPYGTEALKRGLSCIGYGTVARLLSAEREATSQLVELVWLIGLSYLAGLHDTSKCGARELRIATETELPARVAYQKIRNLAAAALIRFAEEELRVPRPPTNWTAHRVRLWQNAVVMAKLHRKESMCDSLSIFCQLLKHVANGGLWPLPCSENKRFQKLAEEVDCSGFWMTHLQRKVLDTTLGHLKVEFVDDPLEVLSIDNAFVTCLRLKGNSTPKLLGWATNVNVRIIAARAEDRKILAVRTIGLSIDCPAGVRECPTYPEGNGELRAAIDTFVADFLSLAKLRSVREGKVINTCAAAYNDQECFGRIVTYPHL